MVLSIPSPSNDSPAFNGVASVNVASPEAALEVISARLSAGEGFSLFTLNLDHLVKLNSDPRFQTAYRNADFISADGWPVVWLLRRYGRKAQRATGADLVDPVCERASRDRLPVYFIGPESQPLADALKVLRRRYPDLTISGAESPRLAYDFSDAIVDPFAERIQRSGSRLCFLSLGAPKQEVLAAALRSKCPDVGFLCVGAALDFISGHATRAPRFVQRLRGEWFWRMTTDPRRLAPRYMKCLALFLAMVWNAETAAAKAPLPGRI